MDVILAHRLLKNSVPSPEYVLMTESAYSWLDDFYHLEPEKQTQDCEGIGIVETFVFYPPQHLIHAVRTPPANWWSKPMEEFHASLDSYASDTSFLHKRHAGVWAHQKAYLFSQPVHYGPRVPPVETAWVAQLQTKWRRDHTIHSASPCRQELRSTRSPVLHKKIIALVLCAQRRLCRR
jgi:hypothetical protein